MAWLPDDNLVRVLVVVSRQARPFQRFGRGECVIGEKRHIVAASWCVKCREHADNRVAPGSGLSTLKVDLLSAPLITFASACCRSCRRVHHAVSVVDGLGFG